VSCPTGALTTQSTEHGGGCSSDHAGTKRARGAPSRGGSSHEGGAPLGGKGINRPYETGKTGRIEEAEDAVGLGLDGISAFLAADLEIAAAAAAPAMHFATGEAL